MTKPTAEEVAKALYESDCSVAYYGKGQPLPWERLAAVDPNSYERLLRHAEVAIRAVRPKALEEAALETLTTAAMNRATAEGLEMTIRVKEGERCGCPCHQLAKLIRAVRSERDAEVGRLIQVAVEAIRLVHGKQLGDRYSHEACGECGLGGEGNIRESLVKAFGPGYTKLVWGNDMNVDRETLELALRAVSERTKP